MGNGSPAFEKARLREEGSKTAYNVEQKRPGSGRCIRRWFKSERTVAVSVSVL